MIGLSLLKLKELVMKIKRYTIGLIGLVIMVLIGVCYLFFSQYQFSYFCKVEPVNEESAWVQEQSVTGEESEYFFEFAKKTLENYLQEELAIIDPTIRSIQTDGLQKYFITLDSIGIDNEYNVDIYHYYMIIHKNPDNKLYVMPFGIEVVKGETDKVRQDLLMSMLKSINGWGLEHEKTWERWQEIMVNMNYKNVESLQEHYHTSETIFYVQSLICFINEYITNSPDQAFIQISQNGLYQKVLDFEIKSITDVNQHEESYAVVEGTVRVYGQEHIHDYKVEMTYKVKKNSDRSFKIVQQTGIVK